MYHNKTAKPGNVLSLSFLIAETRIKKKKKKKNEMITNTEQRLKLAFF